MSFILFIKTGIMADSSTQTIQEELGHQPPPVPSHAILTSHTVQTHVEPYPRYLLMLMIIYTFHIKRVITGTCSMLTTYLVLGKPHNTIIQGQPLVQGMVMKQQ